MTPTTVRHLVRIPELPYSSVTEFEWPSCADIAETQEAHISARSLHLVLHNGLLSFPDGPVWIPDDASDLQFRLCIIAHIGPSGHRGRKSTESVLTSGFTWVTLPADVQAFVRACTHFLSTVGGETVPRPYGPAIHGTKPNDLLQFDYIELCQPPGGSKYVLMLGDDHSDYKWFSHSRTQQPRMLFTPLLTGALPSGSLAD